MLYLVVSSQKASTYRNHWATQTVNNYIYIFINIKSHKTKVSQGRRTFSKGNYKEINFQRIYMGMRK